MLQINPIIDPIGIKSRNPKRPHRKPILLKRKRCEGCSAELLPQTLQMHRKLFLNSEGIWTPHSNQKTPPKTKPIEYDFLKMDSMVHFQPRTRTETTETCGICGYFHNEFDCYWSSEDSFSSENFNEMCCDFFSLEKQRENIECFMYKTCPLCNRDHPHLCDNLSIDCNYCSNCASQDHITARCPFQKKFKYKLPAIKTKKEREEKPEGKKENVKFSVDGGILRSINDYILTKTKEENKPKISARSHHSFVAAKRKNFYRNRFNMPLVSSQDCCLEENDEISVGTRNVVGENGNVKKECSEAKNNCLLREEPKSTFKRTGKKITITTKTKAIKTIELNVEEKLKRKEESLMEETNKKLEIMGQKNLIDIDDIAEFG